MKFRIFKQEENHKTNYNVNKMDREIDDIKHFLISNKHKGVTYKLNPKKKNEMKHLTPKKKKRK